MNIKIKGYDKEFGFSEVIDINKLHELSMEEVQSFGKYKIKLQSLGFPDATGRELYQGDVIELPITEELMSTRFANSDLGRYVSMHPDITSIVLAHDLVYNKFLSYSCYLKIDGDFIYRNSNIPSKISTGTDDYLPRLLAGNGANYIGNLIDNPFLVKKLPEFNKNDVILGDNFDQMVVTSSDKDSVTCLYIDGESFGEYATYLKQDILKTGNFDYVPLTLEQFLYSMQVSPIPYIDSGVDALKFYISHFEISDYDLKYLKYQGIDIEAVKEDINDIELE